LTEDGQMLAIWTKEDDEAGGPKPGLDTTAVASVVGSKEKSTGEVTAGQVVPGIDSESTPDKIDPDAPANATASSPAEPPASGHASPTKSARVRPRSSTSHREIFRVANSGAKTRSTTISHRLVGGHSPVPTPTPLLMNAGTGLYNSDNTQPFKNLKKSPGP